MELKDLQNKKIAILGLGIENIALVRYLLKHKVKCEMTICDKREEVKEKNKKCWIAGHPPRLAESETGARNDRAALAIGQRV